MYTLETGSGGYLPMGQVINRPASPPPTVLTVKLHVADGEEEQMARDIRRVLASRKALKRVLNAITVIGVSGPGMVARNRIGTPGNRIEPEEQED